MRCVQTAADVFGFLGTPPKKKNKSAENKEHDKNKHKEKRKCHQARRAMLAQAFKRSFKNDDEVWDFLITLAGYEYDTDLFILKKHDSPRLEVDVEEEVEVVPLHQIPQASLLLNSHFIDFVKNAGCVCGRCKWTSCWVVPNQHTGTNTLFRMRCVYVESTNRVNTRSR